MTLCRMTCIHASVSRSPRGHGSVAPDKRHCHQWMSSLFCGFLLNPFIHDLFLWRASQEFVKTDLYPLFFVSPVCYLFDRVPVDNRPLLQSLPTINESCGRKTTAIKKTSHLILEMSMNEVFIWLSGPFQWPKKLLMARNFFWIFSENKPVRGLRENIIFPRWTG